MEKVMKRLKEICIVGIVIFALPIHIQGDEGNGTGGGKENSLLVVEQSIKDGEENVNTDFNLEIEFNKNVVSSEVKEINKECIILNNENKEEIPINIVFADDQVEPDKKRIISIDSVDKLDENTNYEVILSSELISKSGDKLGEDVSIEFTTVKDKDVVNTEDDSSDKVSTDEKDSSKLIYVVAPLIIGIGLGVVLYMKKVSK